MKRQHAHPKHSPYTELAINTIRLLGVEAIAQANSGHPGIVLGAAPIMYSLFHDHINLNPKDPFYFNRDRFVLSAGHGSALLYATLLVSGFESITMEDLKKFRQLGSKTPGHPENIVLPGVEVSTGPLGQGIAMGVGLAIAEATLGAKFNKYTKFVNHYTYVLFGDGCLEEGVTQEAIALAGTLKLDKLILLYDSNKIQLDGKVDASTNYDVKKLFKSYHWNYLKVKNGNNANSISKAIAKAKSMHNNQPTIIEVNTIIGYGSRFQGTNSVHGSPLSADQIQELRTNLRYKVPPFMIHENVKEQMALVYKRGNVHQRKFNLALQQLESKDLNLYNEYIKLSNNQFAFNNAWFDTYQSKPDTSTRLMFSDLLQYVLIQNDTFMVGSADLTSSTFITHKKSIPFTVKTRRGQNIFFGVREFAMAAINNGITAHGGCRCITSTFLVFSDYNKAALRLAAISNLPAINVYSHDSITVGEDGPTHEPIEQIPSLRLIPNHFLFRPANKTECIVALEHAVKSTNSPTTIITSRGNIAQYDSPYELAMKGGYVFKHVDNHHINIIATGSEIPLAMKISESLQAEGINARVLSFNSIELFEAQSLDYKATIIDGKPTVSIEFAVTTPWYKYADLAIGIDQFGKSGKPNDVIQHFELTSDKIMSKIVTWYQSFKK